MLDSRLAYVVAVARTGSFTAASKEVGLTQSAVTRSVAELEKQLGFLLFHRSVKGALPTEKGRDFIERAERLLDETQDLLRGVGRPDDPFAVTLRIGVCPSSLEWLLVEALSDLHRRHGELRFDMSSANFERTIQQLLSGNVDVAIGFDAAFADWAEVRRIPIGVLESTFFARKGHPIHAISRPSDTDLARYELVSPAVTRPYIATTRGIFESQGMDWKRHVHVIDAFPVVRRLVATSDAIGHVARSYAQYPRFGEKFDLIEPLTPYPGAIICAAVRARAEPTQATRTFISTLRTKLTSGERRHLSPYEAG
ncbi:DNA-binding transcriptional LysR family regulator [Sphingobium xenophagum]|uniref:DNA-binding transcriptional LysR family regulator n=1 Tax=Sphingobium xenophagum TaxID=121428 RepID=A0ABU1X2C7_SPHXE|nr:LysR family transcriptional regulator [Sphingobium xenophagum]MDR7155730.1 DNA-binding transcriptional LysR family regulator [Sphingobium xenophagum]